MNEFLLPLLKWVGGKRQLLPELTAKMPRTFNTYFEPFIGGGAMLFELHPEKAVIGDINGELINFYNAVKNNVEPLLKLLFTYQNTKEFFLDKRNIDRDPEKFNLLTSIEKAARTYYLNRTCFNGLYRVNKKGFFNVPFGKYSNPTICDPETIRKDSELLQLKILFVVSFTSSHEEVFSSIFCFNSQIRILYIPQ